MEKLNREHECQRLLDLFGENRMDAIMTLLERQFTVLQTRAQMLLGLCGIVITLTGFSGRLIADTNQTAQLLIVLGITFVLSATAVVVKGILHLNWITQQPGSNIREWLMGVLRYRDLKTTSYRLATLLLLAGLAIYVGAIAIMLTHPHPVVLPVR